MSDTLYDGRICGTINVIDEYNREALRIEIGTSISAIRVIRMMNELIEIDGKPASIRLNNGTKITSHRFIEWAEKSKIELRYIQLGNLNQNAFIERFKKSYREEDLNANLFNKLAEVQEQPTNVSRITTISGRMTRFVASRQNNLCHVERVPKSLLMNCSLDREVY